MHVHPSQGHQALSLHRTLASSSAENGVQHELLCFNAGRLCFVRFTAVSPLTPDNIRLKYSLHNTSKHFCSIIPDYLPLIRNIYWNEVILFELQPSMLPYVTVNDSCIQILIKKN